jgi:uncharacterized protein
MRELAIRLHPGVDLRRSVEEVGRTQLPNGGFIICGIGSLEDPRLRLAGMDMESQYTGPYEILTLSGTVTKDGAHLHVSIASRSGEVQGGHLLYGNRVRTTVEVLLLELSDWSLARVQDPDTGFLELQAKPISKPEGAA